MEASDALRHSEKSEGFEKFVRLLADRSTEQVPVYTLRIYCIVCLERYLLAHTLLLKFHKPRAAQTSAFKFNSSFKL
jgi:hypothetical protein